MLCFIFKIISFHLLIESSNTSLTKNQILTGFINVFDNEKKTQNWLKSRNIIDLCALDTHKEIIYKVRDILSVINSDKYKDFKRLVVETDMNLYELGNTYYKIFNVISSVKRILKINEEQNNNELGLSEETIYEEYDKIYKNLQLTIVVVGRRFHFLETLHSFLTRKLTLIMNF